MARRKIFGTKTFSKKHKSRRGRKITSNKTRRFRGGINLINLAKMSPQVRAAAATATAAAKMSPQVRAAAAAATAVAKS